MSKKRTKKRKWMLTTPATDTAPATTTVVEVSTEKDTEPYVPPADKLDEMFENDKKQVVITQEPGKVPNVTIIKPTLPPIPSREQQMARMLFVDFFTNALQITGRFETADVVIDAIKESDFQPNGKDEIKVFSVVSKSNPNVTVYISEKEISATYKGATIKLKDEEVVYISTNILGYVREAYKKLA